MKHGRDLTGQEMAELLDEFVNGASKKQIEDFSVYVTCSVHRTLQQKIMGLFMATINKWSLSSYDLRNEATVNLCKKIMALCDNDRYLPYI